MSDYEIDEIRRIRREISAEHGHEVAKVVEYYRTVEKELRASGQYKFVDEKPQLADEEPADARNTV